MSLLGLEKSTYARLTSQWQSWCVETGQRRAWTHEELSKAMTELQQQDNEAWCDIIQQVNQPLLVHHQITSSYDYNTDDDDDKTNDEIALSEQPVTATMPPVEQAAPSSMIEQTTQSTATLTDDSQEQQQKKQRFTQLAPVTVAETSIPRAAGKRTLQPTARYGEYLGGINCNTLTRITGHPENSRPTVVTAQMITVSNDKEVITSEATEVDKPKAQRYHSEPYHPSQSKKLTQAFGRICKILYERFSIAHFDRASSMVFNQALGMIRHRKLNWIKLCYMFGRDIEGHRDPHIHPKAVSDDFITEL
jgi:hypothetical protein